MRRYSSGQRGQTVNLLGLALRRFESFSAHRYIVSVKDENAAAMFREYEEPRGGGQPELRDRRNERRGRILLCALVLLDTSRSSSEVEQLHGKE